MANAVLTNSGRVFGGVILNAIVLSLPVLVFGGVIELMSDTIVLQFLLLASLFTFAELWLTRNHSEHPVPGRSDDRQARRLAMISGVLLLLIFWGVVGQRASARQDPTIVLRVAGIALMLAGILLRSAAIAHLGRDFRTEVYRDRERLLMCTGIYSWIRHPSEIGLLAIAAGACLSTGWTAGLLMGLTALIPISMLRVRLEDRCLEAAHGQRFQQYKQQVPSFLPRIG